MAQFEDFRDRATAVSHHDVLQVGRGCDHNSLEEVEGVKLATIVNGKGRVTQIPWCQRAHRVMFMFMAWYELTPDNIKKLTCFDGQGRQVQVMELLARALNLWFPSDPWFRDHVWPKVTSSLLEKFKTLDRRDVIVVYRDAAGRRLAYWPPATRSWALPSWDGSFGGPVPPGVRARFDRVVEGHPVPIITPAAPPAASGSTKPSDRASPWPRERHQAPEARGFPPPTPSPHPNPTPPIPPSAQGPQPMPCPREGPRNQVNLSAVEPRTRASPWPQERYPAPAPAISSPRNPPRISRFPPRHEQFRSEPQGHPSPITSAPALGNAHRNYHSARTAHAAEPATSPRQHAPITGRDGLRSPPQDVQYPSMRPRLGSTSDSGTVSSWQPSEASAWPPARDVPRGQAHDIEHPAPPSTFDIDDLAAQVIQKLNLGGGREGSSPRPTVFDVRTAIISHMNDQQHGDLNGRRTSNQARGPQRMGDEHMGETPNANTTSPRGNSRGMGYQCASDGYGDDHRYMAMSSQHINSQGAGSRCISGGYTDEPLYFNASISNADNQGAGSQGIRDGYADEPLHFNANVSNVDNQGAGNQRIRDGYMNESRHSNNNISNANKHGVGSQYMADGYMNESWHSNNNISNANKHGVGSQYMVDGYMNESWHSDNISNANNHGVGSQYMADGYTNETRHFNTNIPNANGGAGGQRPSYEYLSGPRHANTDDRRTSVVSEHRHSAMNIHHVGSQGTRSRRVGDEYVNLQDQPARPASPPRAPRQPGNLSPTQANRAGVTQTAAQPESQAGQQDGQGGGRSAAAKRRQRRQRQKMRQNEDQEMEDVF